MQLRLDFLRDSVVFYSLLTSPQHGNHVTMVTEEHRCFISTDPLSFLRHVCMWSWMHVWNLKRVRARELAYMA